MSRNDLQVTYRRGRAVAAYYRLRRRADDRSARTDEAAPGLLVDYSDDGRPIGLEITAPGRVTLAEINRVLRELQVEDLDEEDFEPLRAA